MKTIALFTLLISLNYANSQDTLLTGRVDTICVTIDDYKTILKFANRGIYTDSLITVYDNSINNLETIVQGKDSQLQITSTIINGQAVKIKRLKLLSWGLGSGLLISIVLGLTIY